jgi:mRNA turnover protein 4
MNLRFLFGKNKIVSLAFGRSIESEYKENLHKICPYLSGDVGLLFTNSTKDEVIEYFRTYSCPDFARSGNIATDDSVIQAGSLTQFQHTMEPQLRQLGMHTSLVKGVVTLDTDHTICKKGDKLSPEQARLLVS